MGCDIHLYVEREMPGGGWEEVHTPEQLEAERELLGGDDLTVDDATALLAKDALVRLMSDVKREQTFDRVHGNRNYHTFALLANVRNGRGGRDVKPIAEPRGIPDDVSDGVRSQFWEGDDHSHSWFLTSELVPHVDRFSYEEHKDGEPTGTRRLSAMGDLIKLLAKHPLPTRIVFWFDN